MSGVDAEGEVRLVFIDGEFSHAGSALTTTADQRTVAPRISD